MTLRQAARRLTGIATQVDDVARSLSQYRRGPHCWAAARDLRAVVSDLERRAAEAERIGIEHGEPDPDQQAAVAVLA